ncbi:component of SufBCD complex [Pararhodobacter oceanensis]|uniref:Component of SufBCD complex n=1 Tax=Pararhodobacter oceanensis TaxID=2172121 RepID=A0A2T8HZC5_9RHOB|nr:component of SufBCD complex [Pararhodobacter oceanensis]PVH30786.1 component of SufBCD complex [Pararhodobacter oceanensis]
MDFYSTVFSTIDLRSFSNIWFWIAIAVAWSNMTHFIIGVPFDMVLRARRRGGQAMADLEDLALIQARRRGEIMRSSGVWIVGIWTAILTTLAVLGFGFGEELAQAMTFLLVPMSVATGLGLGFAAKLERAPLRGSALTRKLTLHRVMIQGLGLVAILITTMWGTLHNLSIPVFGL